MPRRRGLDRAGDVEVAARVFGRRRAGPARRVRWRRGPRRPAAIAATSSSVNVPGSPVGARPESARGEVAVHDQAHGLADRVAAHVVGGRGERVEVGAGRRAAAAPTRRRRARAGRPPRARRAAATRRAVLNCREIRPSLASSARSAWIAESRRVIVASGCAAASPVAGSASAATAGAQRRVDPGLGVAATNSGCAVSRSRSSKPSSAVRAARSVEVRPRPLGVDVVGGQRRDAAPVVGAGAQQQLELGRVGEVRRHLHAHVRPQHEPGDGDGRDVLEQRRHRARPASRCAASRGSSGR